MLEFCIGGVRCRLSLLFPALLTALLLAQPDGLVVPCLLAALLHEGGHLLAMVCLGVPPEDCVLGVFGARIRLGHQLPSYKKNLILSLAGPFVNFLCAALLFWWGRVPSALAHLALALLNLLPAAPLDGGEILRCGLCLIGLERVCNSVLRLTSSLILLPLAAACFWLFLQGVGNVTLLIVSGYLTALLFFSDKLQKNS